MTTNTVDIAITATNKASAAIQQARKDLDSLAQSEKARPLSRKVTVDTTQAQQALGSFRRETEASLAPVDTLSSAINGRLATAFTALGVATAAIQLGRTVAELGQLGAQSLDTAKSFDSVRRSVGAAPDLLNKLQKAAGGTITEMRLMQLTNTALAGASAEMGQAFAAAIPKLIEGARAANKLNPALGDTEFLFQSLVTGIKRGSPMLIDNTGITLQLGQANEEYARSLGKAADALTEEEKKIALLNATMAGVDRLVQQAGGSLESMSSKADKLKTSTTELRTELGKLVAKPYTIVIEQVIKGVNGVTNMVEGTNALNQALDTTDVQRQIQGIAERIKYLDDLIDRSASGERIYRFNAENAKREIAFLESQLRGLAGAHTETGNAAGVAGVRAADAANQAKKSVDGVNDALGSSKDYWDAWAGFAENAAIRASNAAWAARSAMGQVTQGKTTGTFNEPSKTRWGLYADWGRNFIESPTSDDPVKAWLKRQETANKTAAKSFQSEYDRAAQEATNRFKGYLSQGMNASISLKDMRADVMKPGANGPFENLYRALDIAVNGTDKSPWDEVLGMDQETAKKISQDFQNGIFSPEVMGLVDVDALVNQAKMAELAEKSQEAFAKAIASKAGVKVNLVEKMFGFGGSTEGGANADSAAQKQVDAAMQQVATSIGSTVKGKDFADKMIGFGETIWDGLGEGIVKKAKQSSALTEAIDGMVANALAKRGATASGNGAASSARNQGVPGA